MSDYMHGIVESIEQRTTNLEVRSNALARELADLRRALGVEGKAEPTLLLSDEERFREKALLLSPTLIRRWTELGQAGHAFEANGWVQGCYGDARIAALERDIAAIQADRDSWKAKYEAAAVERDDWKGRV